MGPQNDIHVDEDSASLGKLVSRMAGDLGDIVRKEVELAKIEVKEEISRTGQAVGAFGGAAVAAHTAFIMLSVALALVLDHFMPSPAAFAIVGALYALTAGILAKQGQAKVKQIRTLPETKETIKEDAQWVKTRNS